MAGGQTQQCGRDTVRGTESVRKSFGIVHYYITTSCVKKKGQQAMHDYLSRTQTHTVYTQNKIPPCEDVTNKNLFSLPCFHAYQNLNTVDDYCTKRIVQILLQLNRHIKDEMVKCIFTCAAAEL